MEEAIKLEMPQGGGESRKKLIRIFLCVIVLLACIISLTLTNAVNIPSDLREGGLIYTTEFPRVNINDDTARNTASH